MSRHGKSDMARRHRISSSSWVHRALGRRLFSRVPWASWYWTELSCEANLAFLESFRGLESLLGSVPPPIAFLGGLGGSSGPLESGPFCDASSPCLRLLSAMNR